MKSLNMIACISKDLGIGKDGKLLWSIPEDMKFFRTTTQGSTVVMGGNTYRSIGRPLPNRRNLVLSRTEPTGNVEWLKDRDELLKVLAETSGEVFIIGGASLYAMFLKDANTLFLTEVDGAKPADTYFPEFDRAEYNVETLQAGVAPDGPKYSIKKYTRKADYAD